MKHLHFCLFMVAAFAACSGFDESMDPSPLSVTVQELTCSDLPPPPPAPARTYVQAWIDNHCGPLPDLPYVIDAPNTTPVSVGLTVGAGESLVGGRLLFRGAPPDQWRGVRLTASTSRLEGVTFEWAELVTNNVASHVAEIVGASGAVVVNNTFNTPQKFFGGAPQPAGDCLIATGNSNPVGGLVTGNHFNACAANGVSAVITAHDLEISGNTFGTIPKVPIEIKLTGAGTDIAIIGNDAEDLLATGKACVEVTATNPISGLLLEENLLWGCGISIVNATSLVIQHNTVSQWGPAPGLELRKETQAYIWENFIERTLLSDHPTVKISHQGGSPQLPGDFKIVHNEFYNGGTGRVVEIQNPQSVYLDFNIFVGEGDGTNVSVSGVTRPVAQVEFIHNFWHGNFVNCTKMVNVLHWYQIESIFGADDPNHTPCLFI